MNKAHRLKPRKQEALAVGLNFLLGASNNELSNFELAKLATVSDLRRELHDVLDRIIDQMAQAALAGWFKANDRQTLKAALENEESALEWAKRMIRDRQRSGDELIPRAALPPGAAHRAAALRYQERNIAEGKCSVCPQPLARTSVRYCEKHLAMQAARKKPRNAKGEQPGTIGYLYGDGVFESIKGHHPKGLAALKKNRENWLAKQKKEREGGSDDDSKV